jgi:hypothetical protein
MWLLDQLERQGVVRVAVPPRPEEMLKQIEENVGIFEPKMDIVDIFCERLKWKDGSVKTILITPNEELALALRPDWLPGQQQAVNWYRNTIHALVDQLQKQFRKP